jgi:hypothetical protein
MQFLLNQDPKELFAHYQQIRKRSEEQIGNYFGEEKVRIGHNLAVITWGCSIFDRFVHSVCPELESLTSKFDFNKVLCEYMSILGMESGQSMVMIDNKGKREIQTRNELFDFLSVFSEMIETQDQAIMAFDERKVFYLLDKENQLYLNMKLCYTAYRDFCRRHSLHPHGYQKLRSLLKDAEGQKAPWLRDRSKTLRQGDKVARMAIYDKPNLIRNGVWHEASENGQEDPNMASAAGAIGRINTMGRPDDLDHVHDSQQSLKDMGQNLF